MEKNKKNGMKLIVQNKQIAISYKYFNFELFAENGMADKEDLIDIAHIFKSTMPQMLDDLRIAFSHRDFIKIGLVAHRIKPSIQMLNIKEAIDPVIFLCRLEKEVMHIIDIKNNIIKLEHTIDNVLQEMHSIS